MQIGIITLDGMKVGVVALNGGGDSFVPDLNGYEPQGRASETPQGGSPASPGPAERQGGASAKGRHGPRQGHHGHGQGGHGGGQPAASGAPFSQGSAQTDAAILEASKAHGLDPNTMRSIASIESGMNPSSNANRSTQYKGLYQVGHEEWQRFGQGNIYSAHDNAHATARMFEANRNQFKTKFGREPTDTELYMIHQQGLGFYTRGAMTNISGNRYPGMHGPQTHESFEAGWGRELARRKARFEGTPSADGKSDKRSDAGQPYQVATNVQEPHYTQDDINELISERGKTVTSSDVHRPDLNELDDTYNGPQQERFNRPYAHKPQQDPSEKPPTGAEKKEPLPSQFYPPTPGDEHDPDKPGTKPGWDIPSDYDLG